MTIEPTAAHTVYRLAVMPPKPAPRVLAPALSMAGLGISAWTIRNAEGTE